jgi:tight adherence protein B
VSPLLPAGLLAAAAVVAVGVPVPPRPGVLPQHGRTPWEPSAPVTAVLAFAALVVPLGVVGAAASAALAVLGRRALLRRRTARARQLERQAAAEAMAVLAGELRAGRPPAVALAGAAQVACGPTGRALAEAAGAVRMGGPAAEVLLGHAGSSAIPDLLQGLAVCWEVCHGAGGSLAAAVDRLEESLRVDAVLREELEAELAGPRSTALLIAFMPLFGLLLGTGLGGDPFHVLLRTPLGWGCLVVGVGLELAGTAWTAAIVRAAGGGP